MGAGESGVVRPDRREAVTSDVRPKLETVARTLLAFDSTFDVVLRTPGIVLGTSDFVLRTSDNVRGTFASRFLTIESRFRTIESRF